MAGEEPQRTGDRLFFEERGKGPRLCLVHGFAQNRRCFGPILPSLEARFLVLRPDAPGHGRSSALRLGLEAGASALADTAGVAIYLGYSMGARLCLQLAVQHPERVRGLVLIGGTPGIADPVERARRHREDQALAARLKSLGLQRFLDEWLSRQMFAGLEPAAQMIPERLENDAASLAAALRLAGTGAQRPLWSELQHLTMPVLLVTGEQDAKFGAIAEEMLEHLGPRAEHRVIAGAGHSVHLEAPERFLAVLQDWLDRQQLG